SWSHYPQTLLRRGGSNYGY
ncbi:YmjE family protein, partial [Escherichia coli]